MIKRKMSNGTNVGSQRPKVSSPALDMKHNYRPTVIVNSRCSHTARSGCNSSGTSTSSDGSCSFESIGIKRRFPDLPSKEKRRILANGNSNDRVERKCNCFGLAKSAGVCINFDSTGLKENFENISSNVKHKYKQRREIDGSKTAERPDACCSFDSTVFKGPFSDQTFNVMQKEKPKIHFNWNCKERAESKCNCSGPSTSASACFNFAFTGIAADLF